jgi:ABC-type dipeptide/oligopeptide/nickel transport system permease component
VKRLEDLSLTQRVLLAISVVVVVVILLFILNRLVGDEAAGQVTQQQCVGAEERERIREILTEGIDNGLRDQVAHLFEVWMKDYTDKNSRAANGARNAINAHINARIHALAWNPPLCKEPPG